MIQTAILRVYMKTFKLFRGEGSPTLFEGHSARALQELLSFGAPGKGGLCWETPNRSASPPLLGRSLGAGSMGSLHANDFPQTLVSAITNKQKLLVFTNCSVCQRLLTDHSRKLTCAR